MMESQPLHMIELRPDIPSLFRFLRVQGLDSASDEDLGYGVHAWMAAAFGCRAPKPWRLFLDKRRPARILGYSACDAQALREHMIEFADPSAFAVCPDPRYDIASRPMPAWREGRRLQFELQCCPVGRKSRSGVEKDLFLIAVESGTSSPTREQVYCDWVRRGIEENGAALVHRLSLEGFRLVRQIRRTSGFKSERKAAVLIRPMAIIRGELTVGNPTAFSTLLERGIGRHRAFGYGMLLLRPAG